jgi:hypothetical protein
MMEEKEGDEPSSAAGPYYSYIPSQHLDCEISVASKTVCKGTFFMGRASIRDGSSNMIAIKGHIGR